MANSSTSTSKGGLGVSPHIITIKKAKLNDWMYNLRAEQHNKMVKIRELVDQMKNRNKENTNG